jgi:hypothetical protein
MFFIGRDKYRSPGFNRISLAIAVDFVNVRMNNHFMFPGVRVPGRMSSRSNLEDVHAEIICPVIFTDHHATRHSLCLVIVERGW